MLIKSRPKRRIMVVISGVDALALCSPVQSSAVRKIPTGMDLVELDGERVYISTERLATPALVAVAAGKVQDFMEVAV